MSGGHWDYLQFRFSQVIEELTDIIDWNGQKRAWKTNDWDSDYHDDYPEEVIQKFKEARLSIAEAQEHMQRLDWLFSCDDDEKSYLKRLEENLKEIRKKYKV